MNNKLCVSMRLSHTVSTVLTKFVGFYQVFADVET